MNTLRLPGPPDDDYNLVVAPSAPAQPDISTQDGIETLTVTGSRPIHWPLLLGLAALAGLLYLATE